MSGKCFRELSQNLLFGILVITLHIARMCERHGQFFKVKMFFEMLQILCDIKTFLSLKHFRFRLMSINGFHSSFVYTMIAQRFTVGEV